MSPEMQVGSFYQPVTNDLYALGVILFILYAGSLPFAEASGKDNLFVLLARNDAISFWKAHEKGKP